MSLLPETSKRAPLLPDWFPTVWQAIIYRAWGLVPRDRVSRVIGTDEDTVRREAARMGLDPDAPVKPEWLKRGYITIIRAMWHLCGYEQLMTLLGIGEKELAVMLKEEDFLWHKLGFIKPATPANQFSPLTPAQEQATDRIRGIVTAVPAPLRQENAYDFLARYSRPAAPESTPASPSGSVNMIYSYFALYGDPLLDPSLDPFPDGLLAAYARMGVKGIWLQGILYQLTPFPFDPERSKGWETRQKTLRDLVSRAGSYGIGVYLYLNEPRSMDDAIFQKYPDLRGEREGDYWAMCTSVPAVRQYLEDAACALFTAVPNLAGFFTITMSENLTNCYSRASGPLTCPRCAARKPEEVIADVNNLLARGAHRASPRARAIAWSWAWRDEWAEKVPPLLTEGQIIQCNSEERLPTFVGGVKGAVADYSISCVGPGAKARGVWRAALASGHETSAKVQINNSWELSAVPYIPVFDKVAEHMTNLRKEGVDHIQLSWTLGGCPSPMLKMADKVLHGETVPEAFLKELLGDEAGLVAFEAQRLMSRAFGEFPFDIGVLYRAPQNYGPQIPFYTKPTGWKATMVTFPYDDLDGWRSIYPRDVFLRQFEKLVDGWQQGVDRLLPLRGASEAYDELLRMAVASLCHFRTSRNLIRFVIARDRETPDKRAMLDAIADERDNTLTLLTVRHEDDRIGFEAANHYCYTVNDLVEKLIDLDKCERELSGI